MYPHPSPLYASVTLRYLSAWLCTTLCPWSCTPSLWSWSQRSHHHRVPFHASQRYPTHSHVWPSTASWLQWAEERESKPGPRVLMTQFLPQMYQKAIQEHVYKLFSVNFSFARLIGPVGEQVSEKTWGWAILSQKTCICDQTRRNIDREAVSKDWPPLKCAPMNSSLRVT